MKIEVLSNSLSIETPEEPASDMPPPLFDLSPEIFEEDPEREVEELNPIIENSSDIFLDSEIERQLGI